MYQEFQVSGPLRQFIDCAWMLLDDRKEIAETRRVLPDGCADIVVMLGNSVTLLGPTCSFRVVPNAQDFVGFRFRLGAADALTGVPPNEIVDQSAPLAAIWGPSGRQLERCLLTAAEPRAALAMLGKALAAHLPCAREADGAVLAAVNRLQRFPQTRVSQLARTLEMSERQLRRRFQRHVGLSIKQLARVTRFQCVVDDLRAHRRRIADDPPGWAAFAQDHGYADQAHLIRESRAIAGATPAELLANC
jgi:AraC-like DNA-binding protein